MDVDFWSSRVHSSSKHFSTLQSAARFNSSESLGMDDSEGDDDARTSYFRCPFCYVEIEVHGFCSHLQEENCFDMKNAVCPLCAGNLGKDVIGHFIVQHSSSLKRIRKPSKSGFFTSSSAKLGKELSSFLGSPTNGRESGQSAHDSLLPFLCNDSASINDGLKSSKLSQLDGSSHEQDNEERRLKAAFVQGLIDSTIFLDVDAFLDSSEEARNGFSLH